MRETLGNPKTYEEYVIAKKVRDHENLDRWFKAVFKDRANYIRALYPECSTPTEVWDAKNEEGRWRLHEELEVGSNVIPRLTFDRFIPLGLYPANYRPRQRSPKKVARPIIIETWPALLKEALEPETVNWKEAIECKKLDMATKELEIKQQTGKPIREDVPSEPPRDEPGDQNSAGSKQTVTQASDMVSSIWDMPNANFTIETTSPMPTAIVVVEGGPSFDYISEQITKIKTSRVTVVSTDHKDTKSYEIKACVTLSPSCNLIRNKVPEHVTRKHIKDLTTNGYTVFTVRSPTDMSFISKLKFYLNSNLDYNQYLCPCGCLYETNTTYPGCPLYSCQYFKVTNSIVKRNILSLKGDSPVMYAAMKIEQKKVGEHEHKCAKCSIYYVHYHQHTYKNHKQYEYQCPNPDCVWFFEKNPKTASNPTGSVLSSKLHTQGEAPNVNDFRLTVKPASTNKIGETIKDRRNIVEHDGEIDFYDLDESILHSVGLDLHLGAGFALKAVERYARDWRRFVPKTIQLGDCIPVKTIGKATDYLLVTKRRSFVPFSYKTSITKALNNFARFHVEQVSCPRFDCDLNGNKWEEVKEMIPRDCRTIFNVYKTNKAETQPWKFANGKIFNSRHTIKPRHSIPNLDVENFGEYDIDFGRISPKEFVKAVINRKFDHLITRVDAKTLKKGSSGLLLKRNMTANNEIVDWLDGEYCYVIGISKGKIVNGLEKHAHKRADEFWAEIITIKDLMETDDKAGAHIHTCIKCDTNYVHYHKHKTADHPQFPFQCPNSNCEWYFKKKTVTKENPTTSIDCLAYEARQKHKRHVDWQEEMRLKEEYKSHFTKYIPSRPDIGTGIFWAGQDKLNALMSNDNRPGAHQHFCTICSHHFIHYYSDIQNLTCNYKQDCPNVRCPMFFRNYESSVLNKTGTIPTQEYYYKQSFGKDKELLMHKSKRDYSVHMHVCLSCNTAFDHEHYSSESEHFDKICPNPFCEYFSFGNSLQPRILNFNGFQSINTKHWSVNEGRLSYRDKFYIRAAHQFSGKELYQGYDVFTNGIQVEEFIKFLKTGSLDHLIKETDTRSLKKGDSGIIIKKSKTTESKKVVWGDGMEYCMIMGINNEGHILNCLVPEQYNNVEEFWSDQEPETSKSLGTQINELAQGVGNLLSKAVSTETQTSPKSRQKPTLTPSLSYTPQLP